MNEWISGTSGLQLSIFRRSLLCLPVKLQEEENLSFFILDYSSDKIFNTFNEANIVSFINERKRSVVDWCDSFFCFYLFLFTVVTNRLPNYWENREATNSLRRHSYFTWIFIRQCSSILTFPQYLRALLFS